MRKAALWLILFFFFAIVPPDIYASGGLIKPSSKFYLLQTLKENIQLSLSFSKEQKLNYLLSLTDKRVEEMESNPTPSVVRLYEKHYQYLDKLALQMENKERVAERIEENSLRQQMVLAKVYNQVPESAKGAIINAQENSSKHVARTVGVIEGQQKAQEYVQQVAMIQQAEKMGQVEQLPMEGSPNANPSEVTPKELKGANPLMPGQNLNIQNPSLEGQEGGSKMEQETPAEIQAPAGQI